MNFLKLLTGPVSGFLALLFMQQAGAPAEAARMALVVVWMAFWWITEAVHISITSLLPVVLLPLLGILPAEQVSMQYMDQIIFLFMGGFFMAYAMEKWGLHKRIAFRIILLMGNKPSRILAGLMLTTYILSMWISNTATVMMLLPAVLAIANQHEIYPEKEMSKIATALLLALSFTATIGGMATLVGTPPNMIFAGIYSRQFPDAEPINFLQWMMLGVPFSFTLLIVTFFVLKFLFIPEHADVTFDLSYIRKNLQELGIVSREEKIVAFMFLTTVLLWFFRDNLNFGFVHINGWSNFFGEYKSFIKDSTVVMFTSFFLFLLPAGNNGQKLLEWSDVIKFPLSIILLFGAGFALSKGFEASGLTQWMAQLLTVMQGAHIILILSGIIILVTLLSEVASNTASVQLVLPVIIPLAAVLHVTPLLLMLTATLSASLGYMLPVATSANTIVYGSGLVPSKSMIRSGLLIDLVGIVLLLLFIMTVGNAIYGFGL